MLDYRAILTGVLLLVLAVVILYPGIRLFFYAVFRSFFQAKASFDEEIKRKE